MNLLMLQLNNNNSKMMTNNQLQGRQLDQVYDWVDGFTLSRAKKNISRDFSDAVLMAEIISINFPKFVQLHNYPPGNSIKAKISNWNTLNTKVLSKIGIALTQDDIKRLSNSSPMAIQSILYEVKCAIDENNKQKQNQSFPNPYPKQQQGPNQGSPLMANNKKQNATSKIQQLRQVLSLLRQKILIVQRSIQRKDSHIKQLQQTLKMYSN